MHAFIENSVKACMLAQVWALGADVRGDGPVAFVNVSDGVGVGIAIDGKLLVRRAQHRRRVRPRAARHGRAALLLRTETAAGSGTEAGHGGALPRLRSVLAGLGAPDGGHGRRPHRPRARRRLPAALRDVALETGVYLGRGLATIVKAIDPRRVYMGGEITAAWDLIEPSVRQALRWSRR